LFTVSTDQTDFIRIDLIVDPLFGNNFLGFGLATFDPDYKNLLLTGKESGETRCCEFRLLLSNDFVSSFMYI